MPAFAPEIPDFANWSTRRLQFFLPDYRSSLKHCRREQGRNHPETRLYEEWIRALENELAHRGVSG